jgi:hypothetical protein
MAPRPMRCWKPSQRTASRVLGIFLVRCNEYVVVGRAAITHGLTPLSLTRETHSS